MQIIKKGKIPDTHHSIECDYCKTKSIFNVKEASKTTTKSNVEFYKLNCPTCGKEMNQAIRK